MFRFVTLAGNERTDSFNSYVTRRAKRVKRGRQASACSCAVPPLPPCLSERVSAFRTFILLNHFHDSKEMPFSKTQASFLRSFLVAESTVCRSQWPRGLRHEPSSPARTLGSWVQISLKAWMSVCAFILCLCCPVYR
jgi:hypothetical protein